jgi:NAD(P)H-hydrate epimerase
MRGAPTLAALGAQRAGAGYVRYSTPGWLSDGPVETVGAPLDARGWAEQVLADLERIKAVVVGPGLPTDDTTMAEVRELVARASCPVVADGSALTALGIGWRAEHSDVVLTPHDGEHARLTGHAPSADRVDAARRLAASTTAVVLLKGPTTVVAGPAGDVLVVRAGDERLATAGTGDVLSGIIGALRAQGIDGMRAAAGGAWLHGRASTLGPARGLVAGDLPDLLPAVFDDLERPG